MLEGVACFEFCFVAVVGTILFSFLCLFAGGGVGLGVGFGIGSGFFG